MNGTFTIYRRRITISDAEITINYNGEIKTQSDYDSLIVYTTRYLGDEGFLTDHPIFDVFNVFDFRGNKISRENCAL